MRTQREIVAEISIMVDHDEVDTEDKRLAKLQQIRDTLEGLDPSIGIITVDYLG